MSFLDPGEPAAAAALRASFEARYGQAPDAVGRAPGRVNLIGEHVDYNDGLCLPVALPHSTFVAAAARDDGLVRIASHQQPEPWTGSLGDSKPGGVTGWAAYVVGVLWALREAGHDVPGVDLLVDSAVPVGAGLSSSAALQCATAVALAGLLGLDLTDAVRQDLVAVCVRAESEGVGAPTGGLDQTASLLAVAGSALLIDFAGASTREIPLELDGLVLLVTDTRVAHVLLDGRYAARRADCEAATRELGGSSLRAASLDDLASIDDEHLRRRAHHVVTEIDRVRATVSAIQGLDWPAVGRLLISSHASLRDDFEVSCPELDAAVETAVEAGALGARMTGGGFGGSTVTLVPQARLAAVTDAVDVTFAARGWAPPQHLLAAPSAGAELV
ncbi:MAG: galactokinase [Nocardioides sp.]